MRALLLAALVATGFAPGIASAQYYPPNPGYGAAYYGNPYYRGSASNYTRPGYSYTTPTPYGSYYGYRPSTYGNQYTQPSYEYQVPPAVAYRYYQYFR